MILLLEYLCRRGEAGSRISAVNSYTGHASSLPS
jgi:hypothetical protein